MVIMGFEISSRRYRSRSEGRARVIKMIAGERVQIVSNSWFSYNDLVV